MATFEEQVEGMTQISISSSSAPTQDELSQFLEDGASDIINKVLVLRPQEAELFTKLGYDTGSGLYIGSGVITSIVRENASTVDLRPATPIPPNIRYLSTEPSSMYYKSAYNPGFYNLNGNIHLVPTANSSSRGVISFVDYPTIVYSDNSIDNFPSKYLPLLVLFSAFSSCYAAASDIQNNLPTFPLSPEAPIFTDGNIKLPSVPVFSSDNMYSWSDLGLSSVRSALANEDFDLVEKQLNVFDKEFDKYKQEYSKSEKLLEKDSDIFSSDLERLSKNADRVSQIEATEYKNKLQKYQADITAYNQQLQEKITKYKWFVSQYVHYGNQYQQGLNLFAQAKRPPKDEGISSPKSPATQSESGEVPTYRGEEIKGVK